MRYKLVPTKPGTGKRRLASRYVEGDIDTARARARKWYDQTNVPVLICEAEIGGLTLVQEMMPPEARVKVRQSPRARTSAK